MGELHSPICSPNHVEYLAEEQLIQLIQVVVVQFVEVVRSAAHVRQHYVVLRAVLYCVLVVMLQNNIRHLFQLQIFCWQFVNILIDNNINTPYLLCIQMQLMVFA